MNPTETDGRRARVLLLAYACSPRWGSEPNIGWNRAVENAKRYDTWVICGVTPGVQGDINRQSDQTGLHFVLVPHTAIEKVLMTNPITYQFGYHLWHRRVLPIARRLHGEHQFDLVHQVNFNSYREPGYLWKLPAPFVWGPVGGTQNYPWRFLASAGWRGAANELSRNCLNQIQLLTSRRVRIAGRRAAALLAANSSGQRHLSRRIGRNLTLMSDTGIDRIVETSRVGRSRTLKILWVGVLTPRKALHLLIESLAMLPQDVQYEVRVVGQGKERQRCARLARRLGVDDRIRWIGWLSHEETRQQYGWADVFVFTSLRDTTGTVLHEAMSNGVPVICLDHQGAHDIVTEECGVKIPPRSPRQVVEQLAAAIRNLSADRDELKRLGQGALRRARNYLWSELGDQLDRVYQSVWSLPADGAEQMGNVQEDVTKHPPETTLASC